MQPKLNTYQALQTAIAAVRALSTDDGAAPIRTDLLRIEAELVAARDLLARCNIDMLPPAGAP